MWHWLCRLCQCWVPIRRRFASISAYSLSTSKLWHQYSRAKCGTGSASVGFPFDVDSLRFQLARCQPASCGINTAVLNVALALPVLGSLSTSIRFDFSLLVVNQQAVASMARRSKGRPCSLQPYTGRASATFIATDFRSFLEKCESLTGHGGLCRVFAGSTKMTRGKFLTLSCKLR
jgi:hypothetical protein